MPNDNITLALAGNPNSGKTTMFNWITGSNQHVGNWPGVTVEKKEGRLKGHGQVIVQDLPGIYSLSPYSPEEVITRGYLVGEQPSAIINIIDASSLERSLYLTTQLTELGIPVVLVLNMMDIVRRRGDVIDTGRLSEVMGVAVAEASAVRGEGCINAAEKALWVAEEHMRHRHGLDPKHHHSHDIFRPMHHFAPDVEAALDQIAAIIEHHVEDANLRWYAIKAFERDKVALEHLALGAKEGARVEAIIAAVEQERDDDSESIIVNERYSYIESIIDSVIFFADAEALSISERIDKVVTNRVLALPIFAAVMFLVYFISISTVGTGVSGFVNDGLFGEGFDLFGGWVPGIPAALGGFLESVGAADWLASLLLDGIVAGVGAVIGFLPQMIVLFLMLALLEDCGYMARIAFILDRVFKRFGLSGKSFIPILIGTGCGVPGILSSRTIENEANRRITVMTTTFIPCSAKLPIIALIAGALFAGSAMQVWVAPLAYFIGIAAIICSGVVLKKTRLFSGDPTPFLIELPAYHLPRPRGVLRVVFDRSWSFVQRAGTIILLATIIVWFLSNFNFALEMVDAPDSILAALGGAVAWLFAPLGWGEWRATVAAITGLAAKENVVSTFGVLFGVAEVSEAGSEVWGSLAMAFTQLSAFSYLVFNLLCAPCFAAMGAIRKEMASGKWTAFAIGYQCVFAYCVALCIYQVGLLATGGGFSAGTAAAFLLIAVFAFLLLRPPPGKGYRRKLRRIPEEHIHFNPGKPKHRHGKPEE